MGLDTDKIRALREKRGLTQDEAAKAARLKGGRQAWNDIESGRRVNVKIETLEAIAKAVNCKAKDLLK